MIIRDVVNIINSIYDFSIQEKYDNSGSQILFEDSTLEKILISTDIDFVVVEEALRNKCNLIISHHPLFFENIKSISNNDAKGSLVMKLIENKISVVSIHTNLDKKYPLELGKIIGLVNQKIFLPDKYNEASGFGSVGNFENKKSLLEVLESLLKNLEIKNIRYTGNPEKKIKNVSVVNGSGASLVKDAYEAGVDCLITGDVKYHDAKKAEFFELALIDIGHFDSEKMFKKIIKSDLHSRAKLEDSMIMISIDENNPIKLFFGELNES